MLTSCIAGEPLVLPRHKHQPKATPGNQTADKPPSHQEAEVWLWLWLYH